MDTLCDPRCEPQCISAMVWQVDALYVCDPANAWFLQDPTFQWKGLELPGGAANSGSSWYQTSEGTATPTYKVN